MYIIDQTYFIKELNVPNINEMDSDTLVSLEIDIDKYVRLLLHSALGYDLFKDLDDNITDGELNSGADQKWKDLVNGVEYLKDGKTYRWRGLIFTEGNYKGSLLAKYVFYYWLKDSVSLLTGTGEKQITATNAIAVNSTQRLTAVWNDFVNDYQGNICSHVWPELSKVGYVDLIQFLKDKSEDYQDAALSLYQTTNSLGL